MRASPSSAAGIAAGTAPSPAWAYLLIAVVAAALFAIRLTGLPNLLDNEYRVGACVLNAIQGGNWLSPHDSLGNVDKPPMLTWLAALVSLATGRVSPFTLYLPTGLAALAVAWLLFAAGRRHFGWQAGLFGGLAYVLSYVGAQQMATARWDGLFALTVVLTALAAFRAWTSGGGWIVFWLAAAASTLTKGPLGLVLGALGLGAVSWERRSGTPWPLRGKQAPGIALFLVITLGWFVAASLRMGPHLADDMLRSELLRHAVMHAPGHRFWKPPGDFLANFAPWSLLTVVGLWRIWARPDADDETRRFERFCFWWLAGGLLLFSVSPHNPARLLWPVVPPAALIAGRELARGAAAVRPRTQVTVCAAVIVLGLAGTAWRFHHLERGRQHVRRTLALLELSRTVRERVGADFPLTYTSDVPFALQLTFETMRPTVTFRQAAALLRDDVPVYVVVHDVARLRRAMGSGPPPLHEVAGCSVRAEPYLHIVSNHAQLAWTDPMAVGLGPLRLRLHDVRLGPTQDGEIVVACRGEAGSVTVTNGGHTPVPPVLWRADRGPRRWETRWLPAGARGRDAVEEPAPGASSLEFECSS
jgi:Dolichyl-phosphate-mannose-protein mannosyltransferase